MSFQRRLARDLARPIGIAGLIRGAAERPDIAAALIPLARNLPMLVDVVARLTRINHSRLDHRAAAPES
jgi:hypothetical protein